MSDRDKTLESLFNECKEIIASHKLSRDEFLVQRFGHLAKINMDSLQQCVSNAQSSDSEQRKIALIVISDFWGLEGAVRIPKNYLDSLALDHSAHEIQFAAILCLRVLNRNSQSLETARIFRAIVNNLFAQDDVRLNAYEGILEYLSIPSSDWPSMQQEQLILDNCINYSLVESIK